MNPDGIVKMQEKHIGRIAEIEALCFSTPWSAFSLNEALNNPHAAFFAAESQGEAVGYAGMHYVCDEGYMDNIAVHPSFRRLGIARGLLQKLLSFSEENRLSFLSLEVRASNNAAIGLYKKYGFVKEGVRRGYYSMPQEDALIMTKRFKAGE